MSRVKLRIQRDDITREWRDRFIAEHGDPDFIDSADLLARTM